MSDVTDSVISSLDVYRSPGHPASPNYLANYSSTDQVVSVGPPGRPGEAGRPGARQPGAGSRA